jgi:hypothetical protein
MRNLTYLLFSLFVAVFGLSACSRTGVPARSSTSERVAPTLPAKETGPFIVIGHLEHRDNIVTIKTGEQGTVYSVHDKQGKVLHENLTPEQLKLRSPNIHGFIEAAEAGNAGLVISRTPNKGIELLDGRR